MSRIKWIHHKKSIDITKSRVSVKTRPLGVFTFYDKSFVSGASGQPATNNTNCTDRTSAFYLAQAISGLNGIAGFDGRTELTYDFGLPTPYNWNGTLWPQLRTATINSRLQKYLIAKNVSLGDFLFNITQAYDRGEVIFVLAASSGYAGASEANIEYTRTYKMKLFF